MSMNLLAIVREVCKRTGIPQPATVQSNGDKGIQQMLGLMNELCEDIETRKAYQQNTREATFVSIAGEDQGYIDTLAPFGYDGIIIDTVFDRTTRLPLTGGLTPVEWQTDKSLQNLGPLYQFRIRNNKLLFAPALPVAHTIAFEYVSKWVVQENEEPGNPTPKPYWTFDTDTFMLSDSVALSWLRWAWKKEKGLDYAEDFKKYELLVENLGNRDNAPQRVQLAGGQEFRPGILVPQGNWMQP